MTIEWKVDGGPQSRCDVCKSAVFPGTQDARSDKALLEAHGWRWQERDPLDTCPSCLARERSVTSPSARD